MSESGGKGGADLDEIEKVYRARLPEFLRVATAIAGDVELARDAVQDAFASAVRHRSAFRRRGPLEAWLWRAVVNSARKTRRPRAVAVEVSRNGPAPDDAFELRGPIADLPERQRLVLSSATTPTSTTARSRTRSGSRSARCVRA